MGFTILDGFNKIGELQINQMLKELFGVESPKALSVSGGTIQLSGKKHTVVLSSAVTITIPYTGDDITLEVTLQATEAVLTFPSNSLCVSEGTASGDNTLTLSGVSGDVYVIGIKKIGNSYRVAAKNFGQ